MRFLRVRRTFVIASAMVLLGAACSSTPVESDEVSGADSSEEAVPTSGDAAADNTGVAGTTPGNSRMSRALQRRTFLLGCNG
jgi:hypothetical protein